MALIAAHLGVVDVDEIESMPFDWFNDVQDVLGEVVNFAAIVNYAGNAFCEKSWDMILDSNPMLKGQILNSEERSWEQFFSTASYTIVKRGGKDNGEGSGKTDHGTGEGS